jgi:hypothetical protein
MHVEARGCLDRCRPRRRHIVEPPRRPVSARGNQIILAGI